MLITLSYEDSVVPSKEDKDCGLPVFFLKTVVRNQVFNFLASIRLRKIDVIVLITDRFPPFAPEMAALVYFGPLTGSQNEMSNFEKES